MSNEHNPYIDFNPKRATSSIPRVPDVRQPVKSVKKAVCEEHGYFLCTMGSMSLQKETKQASRALRGAVLSNPIAAPLAKGYSWV
jgi:hypothetical protein